jgi:hypothetical protein
MTACLAAVKTDVMAAANTLAAGADKLDMAADVCMGLEELWAKRDEAFEKAVCVVKATRAKCAAEANAAGAKTALDEMGIFCPGDPVDATKQGSAPMAPPMAPPPPPPAP